MGDLEERVAKLLEHLEMSHIILVEWEARLKIRLGYPLVSNESLFFLVPDSQLQTACDLAAELELHPTDNITLPPVYTSEFSGRAIRYLIDDSSRYPSNEGPARRRLVFLPMSWTGITCDELIPICATEGSQPTLPCTVWTVPLPAACAAFVHIAAHEKRGGWLRTSLIEGLSSVLAYSLFDMSYEGHYMELPLDDEPLSNKEILEVENAVVKMNCWVLRSDQEWIRQILIQIITGKKSYDDLPYQQDMEI